MNYRLTKAKDQETESNQILLLNSAKNSACCPREYKINKMSELFNVIIVAGK